MIGYDTLFVINESSMRSVKLLARGSFSFFFGSKKPTYKWHFFPFSFQCNNLRSRIKSSETEGGPLLGTLAVCSGFDWTREDQSFQWKADE